MGNKTKVNTELLYYIVNRMKMYSCKLNHRQYTMFILCSSVAGFSYFKRYMIIV